MTSNYFTRLELLAVTICVMVLGTLMLPILGAAQEDATLVACTAQLKKINQAHQLYLNDNKGYFIPDSGMLRSKNPPPIAFCTGRAINYKREKGRMLHADPLNQQFSAFVPVVMRYMNRDFTPLYCPGDYRMNLQPCLYSAFSSYAYHYDALGRSGRKLDDIGEPAEVVLYGESSQGRGIIASTPEGKGWMYFRNLNEKDISHKPHKDAYNFTFLDGHVTTWKLEEVLQQAFDDGL